MAGKDENLDRLVEREDIIELRELVRAEAILGQILAKIEDYFFSHKELKEQLGFIDNELKAAKSLLMDAKRHDTRASEFVNKLLQSLSVESRAQMNPNVRVVLVSLHNEDEMILKNVLSWQANLTLILHVLNNLAFIVSQDLEAVTKGNASPAYSRDLQGIGSHISEVIARITVLIESARKAYRIEESERRLMAKRGI